MKLYLQQWKALSDKVASKIIYFEKDSNNFVPISDALNWVMPGMCTSYNDISTYIKKHLEKAENVDKT